MQFPKTFLKCTMLDRTHEAIFSIFLLEMMHIDLLTPLLSTEERLGIGSTSESADTCASVLSKIIKKSVERKGLKCGNTQICRGSFLSQNLPVQPPDFSRAQTPLPRPVESPALVVILCFT